MLGGSQTEPTELIGASVAGRSPEKPPFAGASCLAMRAITKLCRCQHRPDPNFISVAALGLAMPVLRALEAGS